ncbi:hypothetical protein FB45DRAFT_161714 [Roridomyces roridus]|uniref:F-box domain-containing protein n=1 Tax=Roridomyces roridus TaxID=1738132 RepID=A0AAD7BFQ3_9AGAR|nr:hypothetical protein FB45DRAFT_161714 [Roridomyces roridus]
MPAMDIFPPELTLQIFPHLPLKGLVAAEGVCQQWKQFIAIADIYPPRRGLFNLYKKIVHDPLFRDLDTRPWLWENLRPFDRQAYLDHILAQHNYIPEDFRLWILEWPNKAVIACAWPGLPEVYCAEDADDVERVVGYNHLGCLAPQLYNLMIDLDAICPPEYYSDGEAISDDEEDWSSGSDVGAGEEGKAPASAEGEAPASAEGEAAASGEHEDPTAGVDEVRASGRNETRVSEDQVPAIGHHEVPAVVEDEAVILHSTERPEDYYQIREVFKYSPPPGPGKKVFYYPALLVWEKMAIGQIFLALSPHSPFSVYFTTQTSGSYCAGNSYQYSTWIAWLEAQLRRMHRAADWKPELVGFATGYKGMSREPIDDQDAWFRSRPRTTPVWTEEDEENYAMIHQDSAC